MNFSRLLISVIKTSCSMSRDDEDRHQIQRDSDSRFHKRIDSFFWRGQNERSLLVEIYRGSRRIYTIWIEAWGRTRGSSSAIVVLLEFAPIHRCRCSRNICRINFYRRGKRSSYSCKREFVCDVVVINWINWLNHASDKFAKWVAQMWQSDCD